VPDIAHLTNLKGMRTADLGGTSGAPIASRNTP
jgi:hypothetical protein